MSILDVLVRILLAAVLGGAIGLEREIREHAAGFRTHILVAVGAAAFTLASAYGLEGTAFDPNRISAQVVTGIGFLGAGAIIRYGATVRGLTTAASLWTVAAVGLLAGKAFYSAALITTAVVILSLYALRQLENRLLYPRLGQSIGVQVYFRSGGYRPLARLVEALREARVDVKEMAAPEQGDEGDAIHLLLKLPRGLSQEKLTVLIAGLDEVRSVSLD